MGTHATAAITLENLMDVYDADRVRAGRIRSVTVPDAVVDPWATLIALPRHVVTQLGLQPTGRKRVSRDGNAASSEEMLDPVRLTIMDRSCSMDVVEAPDGQAVVIGRILLLALDLVIDPVRRCLIGNPAHGGEQIIEL